MPEVEAAVSIAIHLVAEAHTTAVALDAYICATQHALSPLTLSLMQV